MYSSFAVQLSSFDPWRAHPPFPFYRLASLFVFLGNLLRFRCGALSFLEPSYPLPSVVLDDCGLLSRRENEATYRSPPFRERLTCAHIDQQGAWKYNRGGQTSVHAGRRTNDRPNATRRERGRCRATGMVRTTKDAPRRANVSAVESKLRVFYWLERGPNSQAENIPGSPPSPIHQPTTRSFRSFRPAMVIRT